MAIRIAVDAHGGDVGLGVNIAATRQALQDSELRIVLVGDAATIQRALGARFPGRERLDVVHAAEAIGMGESAVKSLRRKADSSIGVALQLHKAGDVDGVVSAGNSGAMVAAGLMALGRIPGVSRPALGTCFPSPGPPTFFLDIGAVVDPRPEVLLQFGYLGAAYSEHVLNVARPTVALLSNGEEASKGNALTREARDLLACARLHFTGYVEGRELLTHPAAVIVTDGFTGNIALKTAEGTANAIQALMRREFLADLRGKLGSLVLKPAFKRVRGHLDYDRIGGAPLLGVRGVVIVSHGSAPVNAIANAVGVAARSARINLPELLRNAVPSEASTAAELSDAETRGDAEAVVAP
jgi:glycerol-3-phosphate acyltransferase PlsX